MNVMAFFGRQFAHPRPGIVVFVGLGAWIVATVWSIVGAVLTEFTALTFALVAVIAVAIGVLGTLTILIGAIWYGVLILFDLRAARRRAENSQ